MNAPSHSWKGDCVRRVLQAPSNTHAVTHGTVGAWESQKQEVLVGKGAQGLAKQVMVGGEAPPTGGPGFGWRRWPGRRAGMAGC